MDPGTTIARRPSRTRRPRTTAAAARRSSTREFVHEPMNTVSTSMPRMGVPAFSPMYPSARRADSRSDGSAKESGSGTTSSMVVVWLGFVPQLTDGRMSAASRTTSLSNTAPASVGRPRQSSSARSQSFPAGAKGRPSR